MIEEIEGNEAERDIESGLYYDLVREIAFTAKEIREMKVLEDIDKEDVEFFKLLKRIFRETKDYKKVQTHNLIKGMGISFFAGLTIMYVILLVIGVFK
jgi:hypothetical protein